nr:MAG TPA: Shikimate kinase [Caudoviricetes sp.]
MSSAKHFVVIAAPKRCGKNNFIPIGRRYYGRHY